MLQAAVCPPGPAGSQVSVLDLSHIAIAGAGFRDGLGERLLGFDRSGGATLELLRVRPELAVFGPALVERVNRLAEFTDRRFATLRGVARDPATGRPLVVSEHVEGERLSEVLERAQARHLIPDITVALHIVVHALQALAALDRACKTAHGALGLERMIVTPRGRLVVADHALAPILPKLGFSHSFLWRELRVAMPAKPVPARFDARADIAQAAVMLVAWTIGRPLLDDEYPGRLAPLADEVREVARIRGGDEMADAVGGWLGLALPTSRRPSGFGDAAEARFELERALPKEPGLVGSREDLHAFLEHIAAPDSGVMPLVEAARDPEPGPVIVAPPPVPSVPEATEEIGDEIAIGVDTDLPLEPEREAPAEPAVELVAAPESTAAIEPPIRPEPEAGPTLTFDAEAVADASASFAEAFDEAVTIAEREVPLKPDTTEVAEIAGAPSLPDTTEITETPDAGGVRLQADLVEAAEITEPVAPEPEPVSEPEPEPVAKFSIFPDFAVPPPEPPPPPPAPEPPAHAVPMPDPSPTPSPRPRLISDVDLSTLPDWMVKPDEAADAPAPPASPAPPPATARSIWPDTDEVPVRGGTLFGSAEADATDHGEGAADARTRRRARQIVEAALGKHEDAPPPVQEIAPEPESEIEVAADDTRIRSRRVVAIAAAVLLVAAATIIGVQWLGARTRPGTVVIDSTPDGSEVLIDGQPSGTTPITLKLNPGQHTLELRRRNRTRTFTLSVAPGAEVTQSLDWGKAVDTGALRVTSEPDGARVSVDGQPRGETPFDASDLAVGRHTVVVQSDAGSVTNQVRITVNETTTLHVPLFAGWLAIFSPVELKILEGGRLIGTSSGERLMVPPGLHELELVNDELGYRSTEVLTVKPGETASLSVEPKGQVNLNAIPWAEVFVDGEKIGETPMANVPVTIGTREFVFRHPELGERRMTAVVTMKETTHVNVDLTKQ